MRSSEGESFSAPLPAGSLAQTEELVWAAGEAGDLDLDLDADLVLAYQEQWLEDIYEPIEERWHLAILTWDEGGFQEVPLGDSTEPVVVLPPRDVTGDGVPDAIGFAPEAHAVRFWPGVPGGGAPTLVEIPTAPDVHLAAFADLDGDDDPDLVLGEAQAISWRENLGDGTFAAPAPWAETGALSELVTGDVDLDGDDDLVWSVAEDGVRTQHWLTRSDAGSAAQAESIGETSPYTMGGVLADAEGDGDPDLVLSICPTDWYVVCGQVTWLENPAIDGDPDGDGFRGELDCGPADQAVGFGVPELPDGFDNDCDGVVDDLCPVPPGAVGPQDCPAPPITWGDGDSPDGEAARGCAGAGCGCASARAAGPLLPVMVLAGLVLRRRTRPAP
jgi:MYXO-CTERM domain-containing protein